MNDLTFVLLKLVISVAAALITVYLIPYLKSQTKNRQMDEIVAMIDVAVKAAEQTLSKDNGKIKKADVITFITHWLSERNINITDEQLDKLIESAVYSMNNATAEVVVSTTPVETKKEEKPE